MPQEMANRQPGMGDDHLQDNETVDEATRVAIRPSDCEGRLGQEWSMTKKWRYLAVIFLVQVSMNLNTTLYSNGIGGISYEYGVSPYAVRWGGAASFLIAYAFGCELWAPWSEEYGRRPVLQLSLLLVNLFAVMVALAPNWSAHVVGRTLGGLSSAGGSVTLAVITDMFGPEDPMVQHATNFIVLSSVGGSIVGPIVGGFIEAKYPWRACIWAQVIFGGFVQLLHLAFVGESRPSIIMDKVAREWRKTGRNKNIYGPTEIDGAKRFDLVEFGSIWIRPFRMFLTEPIVFTFSLLSGFSDALIFMMVQSFGFVYWQWGFGPIELGLAFVPIGIGYLIAYGAFTLFIRHNVAMRVKQPGNESVQYESRLVLLLFLGPLLPLGLLLFAFTAAWFQTPIHWIGSMFASCMIGVANFAIYMATVDYVLRAYGPYAASATGGNGWARDFLAGMLTPYAIPMFEKLSIFMSTIILCVVSIFLFGAIIFVWRWGSWLRGKSKWAQTIAEREAEQTTTLNAGNGSVDGPRETVDAESASGGASPYGHSNVNHTVLFLPPEDMPGSRTTSAPTTPVGTPRNSIQLRRPRSERTRSYQSQHSLQSQSQDQGQIQRPAPGLRQKSHHSQVVSQVPHMPAVVEDNDSGRESCTNSSGQTGNKTPEAARGSSEPSSLRQVEDARPDPALPRASNRDVHVRFAGANESANADSSAPRDVPRPTPEDEKVGAENRFRCVVS